MSASPTDCRSRCCRKLREGGLTLHKTRPAIMPGRYDEVLQQKKLRAELERLHNDFRCPRETSNSCNDSLATELLDLLGPEKFRSLLKRFGGQRIWIPKPGGPVLCKRCPERNPHIRKLYRRGKPVAWIAEKFALSEKRVYTILESGQEIVSLPENRFPPVTQRGMAMGGEPR